MLIQLVSRLAEAYRRPRISVRTILDREPSRAEAFSMALAGALLVVLFSRFLEIALGVTAEEISGQLQGVPPEQIEQVAAFANSGPGLILEVLLQIVLMLFAALLGWRIGAMAGGRGGFSEVLAAMCWLTLAVAPLRIIGAAVLLSNGSNPALFGLVGLLIMMWMLYMFSAFLAEAHGFNNASLVFFTTLGVGAGMYLLAVLIVGAQSAAA